MKFAVGVLVVLLPLGSIGSLTPPSLPEWSDGFAAHQAGRLEDAVRLYSAVCG